MGDRKIVLSCETIESEFITCDQRTQRVLGVMGLFRTEIFGTETNQEGDIRKGSTYFRIRYGGRVDILNQPNTIRTGTVDKKLS